MPPTRHTDAQLLALGQLDQWAAERMLVPCPICRGEGTLLRPAGAGGGLRVEACEGCQGRKWVPRAAPVRDERHIEREGTGDA